MKREDCESDIPLSKVPLRIDFLEAGIRPKDRQGKRHGCKVPFRMLRLCFLGILLPALFVAGPVYLRYRVFSEQLYPLAISDQRLINGKISTTWCQRQIVKTNATFNAYLMSGTPAINRDVVPVTMTRYLVLDDDMKEYWGFYLLRGSSVTVSTCVRWPGASLTMIRGHKHLHECAFIGDDSSEELEELVEVAEERGFLQMSNDTNTNNNSPSNEPSKMKRVNQGVQFHQEHNRSTDASTTTDHHLHHHRHQHQQQQQQQQYQQQQQQQQYQQLTSHELDAKDMRAILTQLFVKTLDTKKRQKDAHANLHHHYEGVFKESANIDKPPMFDEADFIRQELLSLNKSEASATDAAHGPVDPPLELTGKPFPAPPASAEDEAKDSEGPLAGVNPNNVSSTEVVFDDMLRKLYGLGDRARSVLSKLAEKIDRKGDPEAAGSGNGRRGERTRRDLYLSSVIGAELSKDDEDGDAAIEEGVLLHPDGIAEDRGTVTENTLNDRSNSEFWSSFSSSEERLLECKGLILNLPLTPHRFCEARLEHEHATAAVANTITYRVPTDGYYFFVFNSENEIQPNYLRIKFELLKTTYNTTESVFQCKNITRECSLPIRFFSNDRTVLELPVADNDSQWNEEYIVISTCEPRTAIYLVCTMAVPLLILMFAFY